MLFWITAIGLALALVMNYISKEKDWGFVESTSIVLSVAGIFLSVCMIFVMIGMRLGNDGYVASMHKRRDALVYQAENHLYDDDIHVSKKELANQITNWNEDLAKNKVNQKDTWIGIFIPNIYDEFEFIPIELLGN